MPSSVLTTEQIRSQIGHPIIDADGHTVEVTPVVLDFINEVAGPAVSARFSEWIPGTRRTTYDERRHNWTTPSHWVWPARNTLDRATAAMPRLYYERMDEIGLDFSLVYPSLGLLVQMLADEELRRAGCRAVNRYMAELHAGLSDRMMPVAAIPMHSPEEAIDEMDYAVNTLGMKAILIPSYVVRPIPRVHGIHPEYDDIAFRFDTYGIDSEYDYDPVWARIVALKVVPGLHTASQGYGFRRSISRYVYNHIGSFATSCEAICKSLIMGGVFHRFPEMRVAALEGGVGWAASLYADFLTHWGKRNGTVIEDLNPANLDQALLRSLLEQYGSGRLTSQSDAVVSSITDYRHPPDLIDEFAACPLASPEEFRDLFVSHIYIGCEADDPMNALAFDRRVHPFGARFQVLFGSDISHWDVPDVAGVLREAYELVQHGLIDVGDFREFTFTNAARLYGQTNPDFFKGTRVEAAVAELLIA